MERLDGESYLAFAKRATQAYQDDLISCEEWSDSILGGKVYGEENTRRCAKFFTEFIDNLDEDEIKSIDAEDKIAEIMTAKEELIKERKRLQTVNCEAQDYYRTVGRNELFNEKIQEAIQKLKPIIPKKVKYTYPKETTGVLVLADQHYDSNFEVKGLFGEVINKYDKETFKERMWYLLGQMDSDRFDYDELLIVSAGDALENILRMTSLQKLRGNVIDDAIEFAEFMSQWLVEAQDRLAVPITFQLISGNHDVVRNLTQKPEFPEETLAKVIHEFIRLRLKDCPYIKIEPYADVYFKTVHDSNLVFTHEVNDSMIDYFENLYNISIDTLFGAHVHHGESKGVGVANFGDKEIIKVPSIVGTDPYAKKIQKHSRAGAWFGLYSDNGRELSKVYYLN